MISRLKNTLYSLNHAWNYGNDVFTEPDVWQATKVDLIPTNDSLIGRRRNLCQRIGSIFGRLQQMAANSLPSASQDFLQMTTQRLDIGGGRFQGFAHHPHFGKDVILITDPNLFYAVLQAPRNQTGPEALISGGIITDTARGILGENLLTYPSDKHQAIRKNIAPNFTKVRTFQPHIFRIVEKRIEDLFNAQNSEGVTIYPFLPSMIVETIYDCFLNPLHIETEALATTIRSTSAQDAASSDLQKPYEKIAKSVDTILNIAARRNRTPEENATYDQAIRFLRESAESLAAQGDLPPCYRQVAQEDLIPLIELLFFAGQDTSSALIEYLIFKMGESATEWQERLYSQWVASGLALSEFVHHSKELEWVIKEALRLHPPSFEQTRMAASEFSIGDHCSVPKGAEIHLLHILSQQDSRRWGTDAKEFNPLRHEHFDPRQIMYPFSMGPTSCVGKPITILIAKAFLMTLISKFKWRTLKAADHAMSGVALKLQPNATISLERRIDG